MGPTLVCCSDDHYADKNRSIPGYVIGRPPHTRRKIDNARVLVLQRDLSATKENEYKTRYEVQLGSNPTRGAVWIRPQIVSSTRFNVNIAPDRVILYTNETIATVTIEVVGVLPGTESQRLVIHNFVDACDAAFTVVTGACDSTNTTVFLDISVEEGSNMDVAAVAAILVVALAFVASLTSYLYFDDRRRKADASWKVKVEELKFGNPPEILGRGTFGLVLLAEYRGTSVAVKVRNINVCICTLEGLIRS